MKLIHLFIILTTTCYSIAARTSSVIKSSLTTISKFEIESPDGQKFSLFEEESSGKVYYSAIFFRGQREVKSVPITKAKWNLWKKNFSYLMSQTPRALSCPHAHKFSYQKIKTALKEKPFCFSQLTKSDQKKVIEFTKELEEYIYEK